MQTTVLALALGTASAFVAPSLTPASATAVQGAKDDLVALAESNPDALGQAIGFWCALYYLLLHLLPYSSCFYILIPAYLTLTPTGTRSA
jgi:hypothetical protein